MVAGFPECPFILASMMIQVGTGALYGCPSHTQGKEGWQLLGMGCEAEDCTWWPFPMLLTGEEIPEHQDVNPGDISNIH